MRPTSLTPTFRHRWIACQSPVEPVCGCDTPLDTLPECCTPAAHGSPSNEVLFAQPRLCCAFTVCVLCRCWVLRPDYAACRMMQNGYNISSLAPNKGYGALIKKIIMQTVDPLPGELSFALHHSAHSRRTPPNLHP